MKITISAPNFEAEDNMAVAQVLYGLGSKFENMDADLTPEPVLWGTANETIMLDDWFLTLKITLEK